MAKIVVSGLWAYDFNSEEMYTIQKNAELIADRLFYFMSEYGMKKGDYKVSVSDNYGWENYTVKYCGVPFFSLQSCRSGAYVADLGDYEMSLNFVDYVDSLEY